MSGVEWTDAEHEAVEGVLRGYGFNATIQPLGKRLLDALAPHVEARVRQAEAEHDAALARLAKVRELVADGGDYHHYVVDGPDGEYVQEGQPCIAVDDLRAALGGEDA